MTSSRTPSLRAKRPEGRRKPTNPARRVYAAIFLLDCFVAKARLAMTALLLITTPAIAAETIPVTIVGAEKTTTLILELATTPATRERGLMHRTTLAPYDGMLFEFPQAQNYAFWMKHTPIHLDILFIDEARSIAFIAENATPNSLAPIAPGKPVIAVIELYGGSAAQHAIRTGDKVNYAIPKNITVE